MLRALFAIFISFVLLIIGIILTSVVRIYSSIRKVKKGFSNQQQKSQQHTNQYDNTTSKHQAPVNSKKIIGDEEGEYVDYEEIKESNK